VTTTETGLIERTTVKSKAALDRFGATAQGSVVLNVVADLLRSDIADRSMTLAAQLFTSILPVLIVIASLGHNDAVDRMVEWIGMVPISEQLTYNGTSSVPSTTTFGVVGVLMVLLSATSYARALGRFYARAWEVPIVPMRQAWRWFVVVGAMVIGIVLVGGGQLLDDAPYIGGLLNLIEGFIVWWVIWAFVPHVLTRGRLSTRILLVVGAVTATGLTVLRLCSQPVMPTVSQTAVSQYGVLGLVFTLVGWLFFFGIVVVASTIIVGSLARDENIGRWLGSHLQPRQAGAFRGWVRES
jgi:membrane protein